MVAFLLWFALLMGLLIQSFQSSQKAQECLKEYAVLMESSGIDLSYVSELHALEITTAIVSERKSSIVLDLSIAHAEIFYHMIQLNVSGINRDSHTSSNCRSIYGKVAMSPSDLRYIPLNQVRTFNRNLNWFTLLATLPDSVVVMNDISDSDYFNHQFKEACSVKTPPAHCFVPVLPTGVKHPDERLLISKYSLVQIRKILNAYRFLVHCMVPSDQLFVFNLRNISSTDYWSGLTRLLHLDYSSLPSGKSTVSYLDHLIAGGLGTVPKRRQVCIPSPGSQVDSCDEDIGVAEVSPSVCDDVRDLLPVSTADRLTQCATRYAGDMVEILGGDQRYKSLLLDQMMFSSGNTLRRAPLDSSRLILDVAPGTTGTTSLFLTMQLLNITGRHYAQHRLNCANHNPRGSLIDSDMKILSLPEYDSAVGNMGRVFWGDTPVSERWWHLFRMYPQSRIIMTDVRDTAAWISKRRREHCGSSKTKTGCTVPVPIDVRQIYNKSEIANSFYNALHVSKVKSAVGVKVYNAYRDLIRCAVPEKQQLWIYFTEQNNSASFWNSMISFTGAKISNQLKNILIKAGIPKSSQHTACSIGKNSCVYVGRGNETAIIPSVCAPTRIV